MRAPVRLGREVFVTGRLSPAALGDACRALRGFREAMDNAGVLAYRATATSAVREAGNAATLIDLSVVGAQVVSVTILKPNQRVRMSIADGKKPLRFSAGVAWASFELAKTGPRYRAGIEFFDAEAEAVQKFCEAKKQ